MPRTKKEIKKEVIEEPKAGYPLDPVDMPVAEAAGIK